MRQSHLFINFVTMKVTVMVPIYGVEQFIERCVVSLMEQSHEDVEYIFVNDCTPDGSMAVLHSALARYPHRSSQVRIFNHDTNRGLAAARATALAAATGEAVMIVDSDDCLASVHAIAHMCAMMERTGADIVDGGYVKERMGEVIKTTMPFAGEDVKYLRTMLCHDLVDNNVWARLIKRELFARYNISFTSGVNNGEDYSVMPRLLYHSGRRALLNEVVYVYRADNEHSYTHRMTEAHFTSWLRANAIVTSWLGERDVKRDFATALQLGLIGEVRRARRYGFSPAMVDDICSVNPQNIWLRGLMKIVRSHHFPLAVSNFVFLVARRLYCSLLA